MGKRTSRWGCLIGGLLILIVLVVGGAWWFLNSGYRMPESSPSSPVQVFMLSPSSGDEIEAGGFVPVTVQAVAPEAITSAELFIDGQSFGMTSDSPESAAWTWQAWPAGIHTLFARATAADGQVGQSQTVILNVLTGDGIVEVSAGEGQTLEQVGAGFGLPPDQMAGANPHVDPVQPLPGGQPVQIPTGGGGAGNESEPGGGQTQPAGSEAAGNPFLISILWNIKINGPADKSYCYTSSGDGVWNKIPNAPFNFFQGVDNLYTQLIPTSGQVLIQAQCWGWLAGALKYLGQGETQFDIQQPPDEVMINGDGFVLVGKPQMPTPVEDFTGGGGKNVPPPFALRATTDAKECTAHGNPLLSPFICDTLLKAPVKQYIILVWEWQPKICWAGDCPWLDKINGYHVYEIDPLTKSQKFLQEITNPNQKVAAVPLPWGARCYGVKAFAEAPEYGVKLFSDMVTNCPDQPPQAKKFILTANSWATTGGEWIQDGDCDTYGGANAYVAHNNQTGFGNQPGEVLVGSYIVDDDDEDCYREGNFSAAVGFGQPGLTIDSVLQKAILKFSQVFIDYGATGLAGPAPSSCVASVGKAKQDWSGLVGPNHFSSNNVLGAPAYYAPVLSVPEYASPVLDVTSVISDWQKHPENNHGFIFTPASAPHPLEDGTGSCLSGLGNFQLEIYYFAP